MVSRATYLAYGLPGQQPTVDEGAVPLRGVSPE
jgi:hypothetical protein